MADDPAGPGDPADEAPPGNPGNQPPTGHGTVQVRVLRARRLRDAQLIGQMSPYARLRLRLGDGAEARSLPADGGGTRPEWPDADPLRLPVRADEPPEAVIEVWNSGLIVDDCLGVARVPGEALGVGPVWLELRGADEGEDADAADYGGEEYGEVLVDVTVEGAVAPLPRTTSAEQYRRLRIWTRRRIFRHPEPIELEYDVGEQLGQGAFAEVVAVVERETGRELAAKLVPRSGLVGDKAAALATEAALLGSLSHAGIPHLHDVFTDGTHAVIITDRVDGETLQQRLQRDTLLEEPAAARVATQLLRVLAYLQARQVMHRDVKPANVMLTRGEGDVVLVDFGLARRLGSTPPPTDPCGTPAFCAPEIAAREPQGLGVDVWSLGVVIYTALCGYRPFSGRTREETFLNVRKGQFKFSAPFWDDVSDAAQDFVSRALTADAAHRPSPVELLQHPWLRAEPLPDVRGDDLRALLTEAYETFSPDKVDQVPALAAQYEGREAELLLLMEGKYGMTFA